MLSYNFAIIIDKLQRSSVNWTLCSREGNEMLSFILNDIAYQFNGDELVVLDLSQVNKVSGDKTTTGITSTDVDEDKIIFYSRDKVLKEIACF